MLPSSTKFDGCCRLRFRYLRVRGVDQVADLAADGLLAIGQRIEVGSDARLGTVK